MAKIDNDPDYAKSVDDITTQNDQLRAENETFKDTIAKLKTALDTKDACIERMQEKIRTLEKEVWDLKNIPHTDNSAVIARLLEENERYKKMFKEKNGK